VVVDVSAVHPAAAKYAQTASQINGTAAAAKDNEKQAQYGAGEETLAAGFTPILTEWYGRMMSRIAHAFLKSLFDAAMSSAVVRSDMMIVACRAGACRELGVALTQVKRWFMGKFLLCMPRQDAQQPQWSCGALTACFDVAFDSYSSFSFVIACMLRTCTRFALHMLRWMGKVCI
jgi:hypothetical protein